MLNKLKEVGGKLKERSQSIRSDSGSVSGASLGSGFLCPDCKESFAESAQLQSHWLVCLNRSVSLIDLSLPEEDNIDMESMGLEELKNLITETRIDNKKLSGNSQEIVRKSGAMAMEVGRLQKEIDDLTTKIANLEGMSLVLQETYLSQVKRNEELRELLEQRSMTSPDDVQVLTRELSRLHVVLSEKEGEWETKLSQLGGESQKQSADHAQRKREMEACQKELVASQIEVKKREQEVAKLTNQMGALTQRHNQLTEELTNQRVEISRLTVEKEYSQSNTEIANQLERCLSAVSADKQELFEKIGTEALSGALSDTFVQQIQSDLTESRTALKQERETAVRREEQLTARHQTETRERESQLSELRDKLSSMREDNEQLKSEVSNGKHRETELTNQLQVVEGQVASIGSQLATANKRSAEEQAGVSGLEMELRGVREKLLTGNENQLIERTERERQLQQEQNKTRDLEMELQTARADFIELNRLIDEKESDLSRTLNRAEKSEEDLSNTLELKNSLSSQILEMDCTIQELRQQLEAKSVSCSEQKLEIDRLTEDMDQLGEQLEAGGDTIKKQSEEHESVKSLLIEQKLELQGKLSSVEGKTRGLESQLSAEMREKESRLVAFQQELQLSTERGGRITAESADLRDQLEKEKTLSQLTRTNLQQEISSLRDDVRAGGTERVGLQERLDIQFGRMAVMDAKLQSLKDENQHLIGAQLERDSSISAYKQKVHGLEVELGDTKSALYEIAHENQKQIMKEAKVADRKWQDDTLVLACSNCHKKFSLAVRKHHCRSCGQIFCQECAQGQADLPSYKGKVRVCDSCFRDMNN